MALFLDSLVLLLLMVSYQYLDLDLVLDEVFQGLDSITAGRLRDNLEQWGQGRTMLYISHSMQHLQKIDRIYVLEKGQIVEQGTADELLHKKNSRFYRMWELERQQIAVENNL